MRPAGSRWRVTARAISSTIAPIATRANATSTGASTSTATLIERKLDPQISASSANRGRQSCCVACSVTGELCLPPTGYPAERMPTEPSPLTLADVARRAVEICDPDDRDAVLGQYFLQFEDADEPITAIQNLEERLALAAEGVDADVDMAEVPRSPSPTP